MLLSMIILCRHHLLFLWNLPVYLVLVSNMFATESNVYTRYESKIVRKICFYSFQCQINYRTYCTFLFSNLLSYLQQQQHKQQHNRSNPTTTAAMMMMITTGRLRLVACCTLVTEVLKVSPTLTRDVIVLPIEEKVVGDDEDGDTGAADTLQTRQAMARRSAGRRSVLRIMMMVLI